MRRFIATVIAVPLAACVAQDDAARGHVAAEEADDYRISVEIPLELDADDGADGRLLKVDELLDERTDFDADDFALDEVVLVARSASGEGGNAELLVLEWRSGLIAVPEGGEGDWFEVRIPAPEDDLGGAWLLDLTGAVTVEMLVAVLEPKPRLVEEATTTFTTYRTRTVYSERYPRTHYVHWLYDPTRYYVYHDYGIWPYRYFIGAWDYRYYDLGYRPHYHHYGPIYRERHRHQRTFRERERNQHGAVVFAERRRISPELVKLRRNHPRLRTFRQRHPAGTVRQGAFARSEPARPRVTERRAAERPRRTAVVRETRTVDALEHPRSTRAAELRHNQPARANAHAETPIVVLPRHSRMTRSRTQPGASAATSARSARQAPRVVRRDTSRQATPNARQRTFERPARRESAPPRRVASPQVRETPSARRVHSRPRQEALGRVQPRSSVQPRAIERSVRRTAPARTVQPAARTMPRTVRPERRPSPRSERSSRSVERRPARSLERRAPSVREPAARASRTEAASSRNRSLGPAFERR